MKNRKYIGIIIVIGMLVSIPRVIIADIRKVTDQIEVTADNAETEIESIINIDEKKLSFDGELPDGNKMYKNKTGDMYLFGDEGKVIEYTSNIDAIELKEKKADEADVLRVAEEYLENLVEDASYYQLDCVDYDEYVSAYSVSYAHEINGYGTNDIVYLGIDNELNLILFSVPRPYAFREIDHTNINLESIKQEALEKFYQEYGEDHVDARALNVQFGTDDEENIGFQVDIESYYIIDGEREEEWNIIFIPYHI